jgi:tetratricopeptide (TPR) repeat protein
MIKKKLAHDSSSAEKERVRPTSTKKAKIAPKKENQRPKQAAEVKSTKKTKKEAKYASETQSADDHHQSHNEPENNNFSGNYAESNILSEPLRNQCHELMARLNEQFQTLEFQSALETAYLLYAKSKLLHEIYSTSTDIYSEALLKLAEAHLNHNDLEIAEKHFKRAQKFSELLLKSSEGDSRFEKIKRQSLIGVLSVYTKRENYSKARKILELLEEENFSEASTAENLEVAVCEAEILFRDSKLENRKPATALKKLTEPFNKQSTACDLSISILLRVRFFKLVANILEQTGELDDALVEIETALNMSERFENKESEDFMFERIELFQLKIKLLSSKLDSNLNESMTMGLMDDIIAAYESIKAILIHDLFEKVNESNHRQFFSPLRKYIVFLSKNGLFKETLSVLDNLIILETKYYGKFHINLAKSLELKGKIFARIDEMKKAIPCYEQAMKIYMEMNEKDYAIALQTKLQAINERKQ